MNRLFQFYDVIDLILSPTTGTFPNGNALNTPIKENRAYLHMIQYYLDLVDNILYGEHSQIKEPLIRSNRLNSILRHYIREILLKIGVSGISLDNVTVEDILNSGLYMYIYIILPLLYRNKSVAIITQVHSNNYDSFQFPDCSNYANEYFVKHRNSTSKGLNLFREIAIRVDVIKIQLLLPKFMKWWYEFTHEHTHIKINMLLAQPNVCTNVRAVKRPKFLISDFISNSNNEDTDNTMDKYITNLIVTTFNQLLGRRFNITHKVFIENNVLHIPNVFNLNTVMMFKKKEKTEAQSILSFVILAAIKFSDKCFPTLSLLRKYLDDNVTKPVRAFVKEYELKKAFTQVVTISPLKFFQDVFGIQYRRSGSITVSKKNKVHFAMVLLYIKLFFSVMHKNDNNISLQRSTRQLCAFYNQFTYDRQNVIKGGKHIKQLVAFLNSFFHIFDYRFTLHRNANVANVNRLVTRYEKNSEFIALVSVYVSLINILKLVYFSKVTASSGFLESTGNDSVPLLSMDKEDIVVKAIKRYIIISNSNASLQIKHKSRTELRNVILQKHFNIPRIFAGALNRTSRVFKIVKPVVSYGLPPIKKGIDTLKPAFPLVKRGLVMYGMGKYAKQVVNKVRKRKQKTT